MVRLFSLFLAFLTAVGCWGAVYTVETVPNVQLIDSTRLVSNPDGILSVQAEQQINAILRDIRRQTSSEVAMVVINDFEPEGDIDAFATELFEHWGIGKDDRDNGVLIVLAKNPRQYVVRTGYGAEGALPDIVCARLQRNVLNPHLRQGDFDGGLTALASGIHSAMTDPEVRDELMSQASGSKSEATDWWLEILPWWMSVIFLFAVMWWFMTWMQVRGKDRYDKYRGMRPVGRGMKWLSLLGLGLPLLIYVPLRIKLKKWRDGTHKCPNCGVEMEKVDEVHDNDYLTPNEDAEERYGSVDYDVWRCPRCGTTEIQPFVNPDTTLTECPHCHARTLQQTGNRVVIAPTDRREGQGVKDYKCLNCKATHRVPYNIARTATPTVIIPGGRGFGGGSGGFGGGSFGGGSTGGGGASGGW